MMDWLEGAKQIREEAGVSLEQPEFYGRLHAFLCAEMEAKEGENTPFEKLFWAQHDPLSLRLSQSEIQHPAAVRHQLLVRGVAESLFTEEGRFQEQQLTPAISHLRQNLYALGPNRRYDGVRREHTLKVLEQLQKNRALRLALQRITHPVGHRHADELIRDTLGLDEGVVVTDGHTRRAVLAAWLGYLRQTVGSCFATAPAILVHEEQPDVFLKDMSDLLSTGRLTRVASGQEYSVPLSPSWGAGDLKRPFLLFRDLKKSQVKIWASPGLAMALSDVGVLKEAKAAELGTVLFKALQSRHDQGAVFYTTAEELLAIVLQDHFQVTEADLAAAREVPLRPMIMEGALMEGGGRKAAAHERTQNYKQAFSKACRVFRGLTENALLKAWEFSIASFAETKAQFTRWNLYASLGFEPQQEGGIGQRLYGAIKERLDKANEEVREFQDRYEQVWVQVQNVENRLHRSTSEKEVQWLKAEYRTRSNEAYHYSELRDRAYQKAHKFAELFDFLLTQYDQKFRDYFQEIYDADMQDVKGEIYDDSPAGFRLLYKHGRSNTSQWTMIYGPQEFVDALAAFFVATEVEIATNPFVEGLKEDVSYLVTQLVAHVKSVEFLESALKRMAKAHGFSIGDHPLDNLEKLPKKPWVYTSGGTTNNLVQCYFGGSALPKEVESWVEGPDELLSFMMETLRQLPTTWTEQIRDHPSFRMLMHSPTHAFMLLPGMSPFREGWTGPVYPYTWIKENMTLPGQAQINRILLDEEAVGFLMGLLEEQLPEDFRSLFRHHFHRFTGKMRVPEFRKYLLDNLRYVKGLHQGERAIFTEEEVDAFLYEVLPLSKGYHLKENVRLVMEDMEDIEETDFVEEGIESLATPYAGPGLLSCKQLRHICLSLLMLKLRTTSAAHDYPLRVVQSMRRHGLALQAPLIVADSNWQTDYFAFVVNPGTEKLDFWRVDYTGATGSPMQRWKSWLDGSKKEPKWGIYTRPEQYRLSLRR